MRDLLVRTAPSAPLGFNWDVRRLDGRYFYHAPAVENWLFRRPIGLWEDDNGGLVGFVLSKAVDDAHLQVQVGIPYDEFNRLGIFEPVCTHPDHRRRSLAGSLMREGLLRLRSMGALEATVDTGDMEPANALYDSLGFTEAQRGYTWRKSS
jgi:ribosomal protein S18 acetylase RimI-like enzyme